MKIKSVMIRAFGLRAEVEGFPNKVDMDLALYVTMEEAIALQQALVDNKTISLEVGP